MMYFPELQNMALTVTALTALLTVSSGLLLAPTGKHIATSSVTRCALTFEVVYPVDEGKDPYPICSSRCPAKEEVWFDGVAYKHLKDLNRYNLMIEATFKNGELQGCKMVPLLTGEKLTARQEAAQDDLERCLATKVEGLSDSSGSAFGPAPDKLSGFTLVGNSYYLVTPEAMTWHEGSNFCRQFGATPAIIESQEKQRLLQEMLTTDVWIGLNDVAMEGKFENIDRSTLNFTNWARDQPNNGNGGDEDCTMMVRSLDFMWIDASCAYRRRVLCEWLGSPALPSTTTTQVPTTTSTTRAPRYSCPAGTHMFQNSTCFLVSGAALTGNYEQARTLCSNQSMTLASIHSAEEQTFVRGLLTDTVWIGLDDIDREGDFRWADGTPLDYTNFNAKQPDNARSGENCGEMRKDFGYYWNDTPCSTKSQFLCKMAAKVE